MPHYKTNTERSSNITNNLSYVFNPITGQPLRIGTRTHRQLIKDRLLNVSYMNRKDHIVFDGTDLDNADLNKIKKKLKFTASYYQSTVDGIYSNLIKSAIINIETNQNKKEV